MGIFDTKKSFKGGVHPDEHKEITENLPFEVMPNPKRVFIPISQHIGKPAKPLVKKGSIVKAGEIIAEQDGFISVPIHSSVSGKVTKIEKGPNTGGFPKDYIIIDADESNETLFLSPLDIDLVTPEEIQNRVREAGIVGQGGAAFPTFVKLTPPKDKIIEYVIINGAECEPYLTRDYRFMLEKPDDIIIGLKLMMKSLNVKKGYIGIEDNKPEAISLLQEKVKNYEDVEVVTVKTKYPQGAEKMLISAITGREVPPKKLPLDIGVVIQNIGTAIAVKDAIVNGEVSLYAALTVSGAGIVEPKNLIVRIGTPIGEVIEYCGGANENAKKVVVGGPMMGVAQHDFAAPVMKATSGILVLTENEIGAHKETNCLNCGMCVDVCPVNLLPTKLVKYTRAEKFEQVEELGIEVCMECGTCTYTCPANIPLVQWLRLGKQRVKEMKYTKQTA